MSRVSSSRDRRAIYAFLLKLERGHLRNENQFLIPRFEGQSLNVDITFTQSKLSRWGKCQLRQLRKCKRVQKSQQPTFVINDKFPYIMLSSMVCSFYALSYSTRSCKRSRKAMKNDLSILPEEITR